MFRTYGLSLMILSLLVFGFSEPKIIQTSSVPSSLSPECKNISKGLVESFQKIYKQSDRPVIEEQLRVLTERIGESLVSKRCLRRLMAKRGIGIGEQKEKLEAK